TSYELENKKPSVELVLKVDILLKEFQKRLQKSWENNDILQSPMQSMVFILEDDNAKNDE
ncbi:MAG: hypothetical protein OXB84_03455, partial [Halobacteriovoraceae bacterium]|nr:hypothetical protein [Halobacteriovoraceae bacterium]